MHCFIIPDRFLIGLIGIFCLVKLSQSVLLPLMSFSRQAIYTSEAALDEDTDVTQAKLSHNPILSNTSAMNRASESL